MTKREIGFALSLIVTITLPIFLGISLILRIGYWIEIDLINLIGPIIPIMITSLLFMGISKTKRGRIIGGAIILIMGAIMAGMSVFLMMEGEEKGVIFLIPAAMAIIGGCLGIGGAGEDEEIKKRQYSKKFISGVSIMSFIFALLSVFVALWSRGMNGMEGWGYFIAIFYVATPLWIISVIFNTISTVIIKRKESILQKRTKILMIMLIIATWCLIASGLACQYLFLLWSLQ